MRTKSEETSSLDVVAFSGGWFFPFLLFYSPVMGWGLISHILLLLSIIIGIMMLIKYKPYRGNWFRDWLEDPRRSVTLGLMMGLFVGSTCLILNHGFQDPLLTTFGLTALTLDIILLMKYFMDYHQWPEKFEKPNN
jgi:Predicted membrane protein